VTPKFKEVQAEPVLGTYGPVTIDYVTGEIMQGKKQPPATVVYSNIDEIDESSDQGVGVADCSCDNPKCGAAGSRAPCPRACPGDLDGDVDTDMADLNTLLAAFGSSDKGDVDGDGDTDMADLAILLANWGCYFQDSDGDRLPDEWETNTGTFVNCRDTGTDPNNKDTDEDGISDGDEVLGTLGKLDLPRMGAHPLVKDIFVECDWVHGGDKNKPHPNQVKRIVQAFANAPVRNPAGCCGIRLHLDYGQAPYGGGNAAADPNGDDMVDNTTSGLDGEFNKIKKDNFAANRNGYFHYMISCDKYSIGGNYINSSGLAELLGDDFLVSMGQWANGDDNKIGNTIMHELGHNLGLRHGGNVDTPNFKPNYNSVMNYRYQGCGIDTNGDALPDGELDYSRGRYIALDENNLDETKGVTGNIAIDWNKDGQIKAGVKFNINCRPKNTFMDQKCEAHERQDVGCGSNNNGLCGDAECTELTDHCDWKAIDLRHLDEKDVLPREIIHCIQE